MKFYMILNVFDTLVRNVEPVVKSIIALTSFLLGAFVFYKALKKKDSPKLSLFILTFILIAISFIYLLF